jgi:hypothetical protein
LRVPYLQVAMEVLELHAVELAAKLRWREGDAFLGMAKVFAYGLARCPDEAPPSAHDVLWGPDAAKIIARAAGWRKNPDAFVDACTALPEPPLERVAGGIRFCGLWRYDAAWSKNRAAAWAAWQPWLKARDAGADLPPRPDGTRYGQVAEPGLTSSGSASGQHLVSTGSAPKPALNRGQTGAPDADADAKEASTTPKTYSVPPPPDLSARAREEEGKRAGQSLDQSGSDAEPSAEPALTSAETEDAPPFPELFWEAAQDIRAEALFDRELDRPRDYAAKAAAAEADVGAEGLVRAYRRFLEDPDFATGGWAMAVFLTRKVYRHRAHDRPKRDRLTGTTLLDH